MRTPALLLALFALGCSRTPADCTRSVEEFRATLRTDPTLASVPDDALTRARSHRADTSEDCRLANSYADDAESARLHPPPAPTATATAALVSPAFPVGTPRVHFEITPPVVTATPLARTTPVGAPTSHREPVEETRAASPGTSVTATPPPPPPPPTPNPIVACKAACESVWNPQARVACEQRCDGATPLPDAMASPVVR